MLLRIEAYFECDNCGIRFSVEIDPASKCPDSWSQYEVAEDAIRGELTYKEDGDHPNRLHLSASAEDGKHYCDRCTTERDQEWFEGKRA